VRLLLRVLVSAGVLLLLFRLIPWPEFRDALTRMPTTTWVAVLCGFLAGHLLATAKWRLMVNVGRSGLRGRDAVRCYAAGLFANLCLPSIVGGDVLRAVLAGRATGRMEAVVLGGIADRLLDILALGILILVGGVMVGSALGGDAVRTALVAVAIGGVLGGLLLRRLLRVPLASWPRRVRRRLSRTLVALRRAARQPSAVAVALLISLAVQSWFVVLNAWIGWSIGIAVPLGAWFLAWSLAKLAGLLPISLGGLGVRDAALAGILVSFGVPVATGLVASLIWQSVLIAGGLAAGLVWRALGRDARPAPASAPLPASLSGA
jgi:glycosyltransferase 2 family protein